MTNRIFTCEKEFLKIYPIYATREKKLLQDEERCLELAKSDTKV